MTVPSAPATARKLDEQRREARSCRRCDLWRDATQVVFGEGYARARLMLVGEQPGDVEDRRGEPFVGPAGRLLREVLEEVGVRDYAERAVDDGGRPRSPRSGSAPSGGNRAQRVAHRARHVATLPD